MTISAGMPDYLALVEGFNSPNHFNRLHIDLSDILAPTEMARIADLAGLPQPGVAWVERMQQLSPELFLAPKLFTRQVIDDRIMFYEGHESPAEHKGCSSSDNLRLIGHFEKGGFGSSGVEVKRPACGAASGGLR
jgi:hypothetical protein